MSNPKPQANTPGEPSPSKPGSGNMMAAVFAIVLVPLGAVILFVILSNTDTGGGSVDPNAITTASGLKYIDIQVGTGRAAKTGDSVSVHYTGRLKNGTKFDSSLDRGQPFNFELGEGRVIKGWDEGVVGMKEGGTRKLIIPFELAYGASGKGPIPPRAELTFDIELISVR